MFKMIKKREIACAKVLENKFLIANLQINKKILTNINRLAMS